MYEKKTIASHRSTDCHEFMYHRKRFGFSRYAETRENASCKIIYFKNQVWIANYSTGRATFSFCI